jgi:hypothetical protein
LGLLSSFKQIDRLSILFIFLKNQLFFIDFCIIYFACISLILAFIFIISLLLLVLGLAS